MRFQRMFCVAAGLAVGAALAVPATLHFSSDDNSSTVAASAPSGVPSTSASESLTSSSAGAHRATMSFACRRLPVEDITPIMGTDALAKVDTDRYGAPSQCLYRTPDMNTLVSVYVYEETTPAFIAGYNQVVAEFKKHQGKPYYRKAYAKKWPVGKGHAMPSAKAAFTVKSPKYSHLLIFANDGEYSVRIRVMPGDNAKLFGIAEKLLTNLAAYRAMIAESEHRTASPAPSK